MSIITLVLAFLQKIVEKVFEYFGTRVVKILKKRFKKHYMLALVLIIAVGVLVLVAVIYPLASNKCWTAATFQFTQNGLGGWGIRIEGANQLGIEILWVAEPHFCSTGSLLFHFALGSSPMNKAQVKYEVPMISLKNELSGWVYAPTNAPDDLVASCYVLEHTPGKVPEWPWFQTRYTTLKAGEWTHVTCLAGDFVPGQTGGSWSQPLMVGFEFTLKQPGAWEGTVYLDDVTLK